MTVNKMHCSFSLISVLFQILFARKALFLNYFFPELLAFLFLLVFLPCFDPLLIDIPGLLLDRVVDELPKIQSLLIKILSF